MSFPFPTGGWGGFGLLLSLTLASKVRGHSTSQATSTCILPQPAAMTLFSSKAFMVAAVLMALASKISADCPNRDVRCRIANAETVTQVRYCCIPSQLQPRSWYCDSSALYWRACTACIAHRSSFHFAAAAAAGACKQHTHLGASNMTVCAATVALAPR